MCKYAYGSYMYMDFLWISTDIFKKIRPNFAHFGVSVHLPTQYTPDILQTQLQKHASHDMTKPTK